MTAEQNISSEWPMVPFAQMLAEPVRNGIYKKKEFHGSGVKIINMGELFAHPRLRDVRMRRVRLSESEQNRLSVQAGDLLFARRSLVAEGAGKCSVVLDVNEPTTFESSIIRARPDPTKADHLFLYYCFNSPIGLHALDTIRRQVAVAGITGSDLVQLEIPLPPLPEQRAIAHILGTLDEKIELNRRMNQTLEEMASAIFQDWFVDFGPVRAKLEGREPYLSHELWDLFPDRLVDSELGEIPEGWKAKALSEILTAKDQRVGESKVPEYSSTNTGLHPREGYFKKQLSNSVSKNKVVHSGDLVFGLSRRVLNFGLMRDAVGCVSPAYKVFSVDGGTITPDLIERLIRMRSDYYYGAISGSSREGQSISSDALKLLYILRPPASVQRAFYESSEPYSRRRAILDKETRDLTAQRDALLPNLVSGEVRFGNELLHGGRK